MYNSNLRLIQSVHRDGSEPKEFHIIGKRLGVHIIAGERLIGSILVLASVGIAAIIGMIASLIARFM